MQHLDIAELVRSALEVSGCDPSLIGGIDSHSTIVLDLFALPSICISVKDDDVWLWAQLGADSMMVLQQRAYEILMTIMEGCQFVRGGQLLLGEQNGELTLKALVHPDFLSDGEKFSNALNGFYNYLEVFSRSLMR